MLQLRRRNNELVTGTKPTPDRIAADQLLERARSLDRVGDAQGPMIFDARQQR